MDLRDQRSETDYKSKSDVIPHPLLPNPGPGNRNQERLVEPVTRRHQMLLVHKKPRRSVSLHCIYLVLFYRKRWRYCNRTLPYSLDLSLLDICQPSPSPCGSACPCYRCQGPSKLPHVPIRIRARGEFRRKNLGFQTVPRSLSSRNYLEVKSTYVSTKLRNNIDKVLVESQSW